MAALKTRPAGIPSLYPAPRLLKLVVLPFETPHRWTRKGVMTRPVPTSEEFYRQTDRDCEDERAVGWMFLFWMFLLWWNTFSGSYFSFTSPSRWYVSSP